MRVDPLMGMFCRASCTRRDPIWDHPLATNVLAFFVDLSWLNLAHFFALETRVVEILEARNRLEHWGGDFAQANFASDSACGFRSDRRCNLGHSGALDGFRRDSHFNLGLLGKNQDIYAYKLSRKAASAMPP